MGEQKEIEVDQTSIKFKLEKQIKMIISIGAALIFATNFINYWTFRVVKLEEKHAYEVSANKRRLDHAHKEWAYEWKIGQLEQELKTCKEGKDEGHEN